jgi:tetratricopeptide (TPR) repeat protein
MERTRRAKVVAFASLAIVLITGCGGDAPLASAGRQRRGDPTQRYEAAKALFEKASRDYHIPSAQAHGQERRQLEEKAAALYSDVVRNYPDQQGWASQALRSLGNIRAAQTNVTEAAKLYSQVGDRFPNQDFEVLMAWKSAADLLSDSGRRVEGKVFYQKIIARFDRPDALPIVQSVVRGAKARLQGELLLSRNGERLQDER